jgi:hypothetical protein
MRRFQYTSHHTTRTSSLLDFPSAQQELQPSSAPPSSYAFVHPNAPCKSNQKPKQK